MSVSEISVRERTPRSPSQQLALGSILGGVYVLVALWVVFAGLPTLWSNLLFREGGTPPINEFLSDALLLVLDVAVAFGLGYVGLTLVKNQTQPGLRAGIFMAALLIFLVLGFGVWLGRQFEGQDFGTAGGAGITAGAVGLLLAGVCYLFFTEPWTNFLAAFEEQGWFTSVPYKGNQGVRIRRATVLGALILGFSGIITLVTHRSFGSERLGANDWYWTVPFTTQRFDMEKALGRLQDGRGSEQDVQFVKAQLPDSDKSLVANASSPEGYEQLRAALGEHATSLYSNAMYIPLMYKVHVIMPLILGLLLLWFAYRLVNVPTFADFLIATEAEMNKVSWTTRRRLFQDTIVVLVTVFLMTVFLFVVDILWIKVLGTVGVLQVDVKAQLQKQQEKSQW